MKLGRTLIALALIQFYVFIVGCKKKPMETTETTTEESVAERFEYENVLKAVANEIPFIVHLKTESATHSARLSAFFVDPRGYLASARHGYHGSNPKNETVVATFGNGQIRSARFVGEIQTFDIDVLSIDESVPFRVATFANLSEVFERGKYYMGSELKIEDRMVVMRCINDDGAPELNRIMIGEFRTWDEAEPKVDIIQLQQNASGCSGAPIFNLRGEVLGMVRSSAGDIISAVDAPSIREAVKLIIEKDVEARRSALSGF